MCVTAARDLWCSASWMFINNSAAVMGNTHMKCEQSVSWKIGRHWRDGKRRQKSLRGAETKRRRME